MEMSTKVEKTSKLRYIDRSDLSELKSELMERARQNRGPNESLIQAMAKSAPTLDAYLMFEDALSNCSIGHISRELIALAISETNSCQYCLAIYTAKARSLGMSPEIIIDARLGRCINHRADLAIKFAVEVRNRNGRIENSKLRQMLENGFSEREISEIIALVAFYTFENLYSSVFAIRSGYAQLKPLSKQD